MFSLPLRRAWKLIEKASEEDKRETAYRLWLVRYPQYDSKTYEPFDEFYEKMYPSKVELDLRPKDELMEEILQLKGKEE